MFFSIIIPTCNRSDLLAKCLERLVPGVQTLQGVEYEIIVTDDGSEEDASAMIAAKFPCVKWVAGPRRGPAANRNSGARLAKGEWLVFLDDDVVPDMKLLEEYHKIILASTACFAFEGAIFPDNWELLKKDLAECPVNITGGCFWSANICIQKDLFNSLDGFDETFLIAAQEDQDLFQRIQKLTIVYFVCNAIVIHPVRIMNLKQKIKSIPKSVQNWYMFIRKNRNFTVIFKMGLLSQLNAFRLNVKDFKLKNAWYNLNVLCYFIFFMLFLKFKHEQ